MSVKPPSSHDPRDTKNIVVAIVLSLFVLIGWQIFVEGPHRERVKQEQARILAEQKNDLIAASEQESSVDIPVPVQNRTTIISNTQGERAKISTPSLHGTINLRGARFDDLTLANYRETVKSDSPEITLMTPSGTEFPYYAEFGWVSEAGLNVPNAQTLWATNELTLTQEHPLVLTWENGQGLRFERTISVDDKYMFTVQDKVVNTSNKIVTLRPFGLISRAIDLNRGFEYGHTGPLGVYNNVFEQKKYKNVIESGIIKWSSVGGWLGFSDKYWLVALVPDQSADITARVMNAKRVAENRFQTDFFGQGITIAAGDSTTMTNRFFAGAKEVRTLDAYTKNLNIPHFDLAIDFGWLYFITKPFFYALDILAQLLGNFGYAILAFTVLVKLALFPLADRSYVSMAKMKKLTPKIIEIRQTYADDQQRISKEILALYKAENVNPVSGLWPLFIQIPIFFSLYRVISINIEMRHVAFAWINDLSNMDTTNIFTLFGYFPWDHPSFMHLGAWPVLMALTMALQMRMNPPPTDAAQKFIFGAMPWILMVTMSSFPAGLVMYWTWSNMLSIAQQYVIMHRMHVRTFN